MVIDGDKSIYNEEMRQEMLARLKRIEGQVRGVHKMIQEGRECADIVIQLSAIKAAVNRVSISVLGCHLAESIETGIAEKKRIQDVLDEFMPVFKKFS